LCDDRGVAELTPSQLETRDRVESVIKLMAPGLDLILAAGERLSRLVEPEDFDYYPARPIVEPAQRSSAEKTPKS
jgi:hypothetical protein